MKSIKIVQIFRKFCFPLDSFFNFWYDSYSKLKPIFRKITVEVDEKNPWWWSKNSNANAGLTRDIRNLLGRVLKNTYFWCLIDKLKIELTFLIWLFYLMSDLFHKVFLLFLYNSTISKTNGRYLKIKLTPK